MMHSFQPHLKKVTRDVEVSANGIIPFKPTQMLANADNIIIMGRTPRDEQTVFTKKSEDEIHGGDFSIKNKNSIHSIGPLQ